MIHFVQEEEKERKLKLCPGMLTVVRPQSSLLLTFGFLGSGQRPLSGQSCSACSFPHRQSRWKRFPLVINGENLLMWNHLIPWSEIVHIFQVCGWNYTSKGLGLLLTCAWAFINHASAFLEMSLEIKLRDKLFQTWPWNLRLRKQAWKAPFKQSCFSGEAELAKITDRNWWNTGPSQVLGILLPF